MSSVPYDILGTGILASSLRDDGTSACQGPGFPVKPGNILKDLECDPSRPSEMPLRVWKDVAQNRFELYCQRGAPGQDAAFRLLYNGQLRGKCAWCGGRNFGRILASGSPNEKGEYGCFVGSYMLSREPNADEPCGDEPCGKVCGDQGIVGFRDWVDHDFDTRTAVYSERRWCSSDGLGPDTDFLFGSPPCVDTSAVHSVQRLAPAAVQRNPATMIADPFERCDLSRDGKCDEEDVSIMIAAVGNCIGDGNYNDFADVNRDGCVTLADKEELFQAEMAVSIGSAKVWVGLANSDAVGLRYDLKAEVYLSSVKIAEGQLNSVAGGSSGFRNAKMSAIPVRLSERVEIPANAVLEIQVSARRTCFGQGHASGRARLWFNDPQASSGFDLLIGDTTHSFFLGTGFRLQGATGTTKNTIDLALDSRAACPDRPFIAFGRWGTALQ